MAEINEAQQQTMDAARRQASVKEKQHQPSRRVVTRDLTNYEELLGNYAASFITTASGNTYEIQKIDPGTYMAITGSPLIQALNSADIDLSDQAEIDQAIAEIPEEEKLQYVQTDEFLLFMQKIVCAGVVSLNLVCKHQNKCNKLRQELSVDLLTGNDLIELYNAIMSISVPESEGEAVENFRPDGEEEQE